MLSGRRNLPGLRMSLVILAGAGLDAVLITSCRSRYFPLAPFVTVCRDRTGLRMSLVVLAGAGLDAVLGTGRRCGDFPSRPIMIIRIDCNFFGFGLCTILAFAGLDALLRAGRRGLYRAIVPDVNRLKLDIGIPIGIRLCRGVCVSADGSFNHSYIFRNLAVRIPNSKRQSRDVLQ